MRGPALKTGAAWCKFGHIHCQRFNNGQLIDCLCRGSAAFAKKSYSSLLKKIDFKSKILFLQKIHLTSRGPSSFAEAVFIITDASFFLILPHRSGKDGLNSG